MPESRPPIDLHGIDLGELERLIALRRAPPVAQWDPPYCGHSEMRIAHDGTWFHKGEPIARQALVRLFSSILRREADGSHVLVTPVEKLGIDVDRTAFRAVEMISEGSGQEREIAFRLDSGDAVLLGPEHRLVVVENEQGLSPRVHVRVGLEAELARPVYYALADLALGEDGRGVWSRGSYFPLEPGQ